MDQTLCPYTAKKLCDLPSVNDEHVLPVAIGAPKRFFVRASEQDNSRLNDLVDAPFSNNDLVRFFAMSQGVVSRSGPITAKVPATVVKSGDAITTGWSKEGLQIRFNNPVVLDEETGQVAGVKGYGEEAMKHAERIKRDYAKKGVTVELGPTISDPNPEIHVRLGVDSDIVFNELLKTAYLATVWVFGDDAINSKSGEMYREALDRLAPDTLNELGFRCGGGLPTGFDGSISSDEHQLISLILGGDVITSVNLFGVFAAFFITSAEGFSCPEYTGMAIKINVVEGSLNVEDPIQVLHQNVIRSQYQS
ncbi:hypothetical protein [Pseudomonas sp. PMCC200344]|uniref:hypothetical protein n=1 Tax=Pseudomonas sp. PMCC200344 TaxID=3042028 RepID=UPI0024B3836E|nr:hypothetical protein [Pseudomonas sp. PMCC200344]